MWSIHATQRMLQHMRGCGVNEQQQAGRQQAFRAGRSRSPQEGQRAQQQRQVVALQRVVGGEEAQRAAAILWWEGACQG